MVMDDQTCRICGDALDTEMPDACYGLNPITLRRGWYHLWCGIVALEDMETDGRERYHDLAVEVEQ